MDKKIRQRRVRRYTQGCASAALLLVLAGCGTPEQRADKYLVSGQALLEKGDLAKADLEFRNALKYKQDLAPAWRGLAQVEEKRQNWPVLASYLRSVVELDPADDESRLKLGRLMLRLGALRESLPVVQPFAERESPTAEGLALVAAVLLALKDIDGAQQMAERALTVDPSNFSARFVIANQKLLAGNPGAALEVFKQAKIGPEDELPLSLLKIRVFEATGDDAQIEAELRKIADRDPGNPANRGNLVKFYLSRKLLPQAEKELRGLAETEPAKVEPVMALVAFLSAYKGPEKAQQELENRIRAGGDTFPYQVAFAQFELARGDAKAATERLEKLVSASGKPDQKVQAQIALANVYRQSKDLAAAERTLEYVLQSDPRNVDALLARGLTRIDLNEPDAAISDARQALNERPQSPPLLLLLAAALERTGAIELAERSYADAARTSDYAADPALAYVSFLQRRGSPAQADELLGQLAVRHPKNLQVWTQLAQTKLNRGDWVGAEQAADAIRKLDDKGGIADEIRGRALAGQNKINESVQSLQSASEAKPNAASPLASLIGAYLRAQKPDEAEAFLSRLLKVNPANATAHVLMATVNLSRNRPDVALANLKAAIDKQPQSWIGYSALGEFYLRQGRLDEATQVLDDGLKREPDNFQLGFLLASVAEARGDYESAIKRYEELLKSRSDSLVLINNLVSLLAEYRTDKKSLERAQTLGAVLRKSDVPFFKDTVGWLSYLRKDFRGAVPLLEEAAKALPENAAVRYHLGMAYLKASQADKAREQLTKAAELELRESDLKSKITSALKEAAG